MSRKREIGFGVLNGFWGIMRRIPIPDYADILIDLVNFFLTNARGEMQ